MEPNPNEETQILQPQDNPPNDPPARRKGPNAGAVIFGLVAIALAGLIIASETTSLHVDWSRLGPGSIVGIGLVLVALGAVGLVRRHDDT
ncbi:MAG: hypothetical protein ABI662_06965 [Dermatophilaceae bacterium]